MNNEELEPKCLDILGKKIHEVKVKCFMKSINELPEIEDDNYIPGEEKIDFTYKESGIILMFDKFKALRSLRLYLVEDPQYGIKKISGIYNSFITNITSKNDIIHIYGKPTKQNNEIKFTYGSWTKKWAAYYYEKYTLRFEFYGENDVVSKITLMTADSTPGR